MRSTSRPSTATVIAKVARKKSDSGDAPVLAHPAHRSRRAPTAAGRSELARAIAVLARAQQDAVWERTCAHNKLRSLLREYYPVVMAAFTDKRGGILRPGACGAGREGLAHVSSGPV